MQEEALGELRLKLEAEAKEGEKPLFEGTVLPPLRSRKRNRRRK
jgi:hypothetical protein